MRTLLCCLALLLLASLAPAQTQNVAWLVDNNPVGGGNAFPWGSEGIRYQCIIPQATLGGMKPTFINDILVAGQGTGGGPGSDNVVTYGDIEIRMGLTTATTLTANWATNNPKPTTVYRGPLRIWFKVGKWNGIGLPRPYLYLPKTAGDNLCFEVIVWKVTDKGNTKTAANFYFPVNSGSLPRAYLYQWTTNQATPPRTSSSSGCKMGFVLDDGNIAWTGPGCNNLAVTTQPNTWPQAGKPFAISLSGGRTGTPSLLGLGYNDFKWGPIALPFDLGLLGAKGCKVQHNLLVFLAAPVLPSGLATINLPIPPSAMHARVKASWLNQDPLVPGGIQASDYVTLNIGR